jgi:sulfatase maturation enzyme AslB (radical SAM superfamily)
LIGLSIDAATPEIHDSLRGRVGNFERAFDLLCWLADNGTPTIVRSVVVPQNLKEFPGIAERLSQFPNVIRWSILEFSPVGEGFVNRETFGVRRSDFEMAADAGARAWRGEGQVDIFRNEAKAGAYLLLTPGGLAYGTSSTTAPTGAFPTVGSILSDHLADLAGALPFAAERHRERYATLLR